MNNLAYSSRDPKEVGSKVEEIVRKDTGAASPVPYTVQEGSPEPYTFGSAVKQALLGGQLDMAFQLNFELTQPRPARLQVAMGKKGIGCIAGTLLYSARLSKPVRGEVNLEPPKTFGKSKFVGDPEASAKLNANGDLVKLANHFARTESNMGVTRERFLQIVPDGTGSVLAVGTLARTTSMGFGATMDAKEFFDLVGLAEKAL